MKEKELKPGPGYFRQMAFGLAIEGEEPTPSPSLKGREQNNPPTPDEARLRSETAREAMESGKVGGWMEDYFALRDAGWPWRVAVYISWASSPRIGRKPESIRELAVEVLGLTGPRQIHHWRETNPAIDEVVATLQAAPLMEHRRDVFDALAAAASNPDHRNNPDRRLYAEMIGAYVPRSKVEVERGNFDDLSGIPEDELDRMMGKRNHGATESTEEESE
jgi:hypothetical protein